MSLRLGAMVTAVLSLLLAASASRVTAQDNWIPVSEITAEQEQVLLAHLQQHHEKAIQFVVGQFAEHDLVLLGETHHVEENCQFVSSLIEPLYRAGVRVLFTEFIRSEHNARLEQLVTADTFDDQLGRQLFREGAWPTWGFQEYLDILKSAWRLNMDLPAGSPKFLVVGIDSNWSQYENWFGGLDQRQLFEQRLEREKHMERIIRQVSLDQQRKGLVHIGSSHTNTKQGVRLGKALTDRYGHRIKQVALHWKWPGRNESAPITDLLERLALQAGDSKPIGFEIAGTPLDRLRDTSVVYWQAIPNASLGDFAQSYVVLKPIAELHDVTWIPGFITSDMYEKAKSVAVRMRYVQPDAVKNAEELDRAMQAVFAGAKRN